MPDTERCPLTILCVDDDDTILMYLKSCFSKTVHTLLTASSGQDALDCIRDNDIDLALLDYNMPGMNGIELLEIIKSEHEHIDVIMLTSYTDISLVVQAMKLGALDYLLKPLNCEYLKSRIDGYCEMRALQRDNIFLKQQLTDKFHPHNIIGVSPVMQDIFAIIGKVANHSNTVLIQGESGTGKEQVARAIHFSGNRADKLFIAIDCGSINPNLIESELFGHEKGAFTGAHQKKTGLMKAVGDGTLFFDEIGELTPEMQTKLLRALQEMEIRPVGSTSTEKIHGRIIAATNQDLVTAVEKGTFRRDLFYRLNVVFIEMPPLRERPEDIELLVRHFIGKFSESRRIEKIDSEALEILKGYSWPGNVRELENCIERACVLGSGTALKASDLPDAITNHREQVIMTLRPKTLEEYEKEAILKTLAFTKGNKRQTAILLGISKSTLYDKLDKYRLLPE